MFLMLSGGRLFPMSLLRVSMVVTSCLVHLPPSSRHVPTGRTVVRGGSVHAYVRRASHTRRPPKSRQLRVRADAAWEKHLGQAWARQVDLFHPEFVTATKTAFLKDLLGQTIQRGESRARALSSRSVRVSPRASASRAPPKNAGE